MALGLSSYRPSIMGTKHAISSGHYLATSAGYRILEQGGNAIDAGVASGIVINVVLPHWTSFGGVAPIILHHAKKNETVTISGLGKWPKDASAQFFSDNFAGELPEGIMRTVTPAAADAWLTALKVYGTMTFEQVVTPALELAEFGFPVPKSVHQALLRQEKNLDAYDNSWNSTRKIFFPNSKAPSIGDKLIQSDLANTFKRMIEIERANSNMGREGAIQSVRDYFYKGEIGKQIVAFCQENGGLLTENDMAEFQVEIEKPTKGNYKGIDVFTCGPWCQGPVVIETLHILESFNLRDMGHNSADYIHTVIEALKLSFSDREFFFGDPNFVDVPIQALMSKAYSEMRKTKIDLKNAAPAMPAPGDPSEYQTESFLQPPSHPSHKPGGIETDTSYTCVVDRWGNAFSATPSDGIGGTPIVPGLGFITSSRGSQNWLDSKHPSCIQPLKRPRLTPSPAMAFRDGKVWLPFGTPGGDMQPQAMVQVFLNIVEFEMDPQQAIEAPRFSTWSFPGSFWPHNYNPGLACFEDRIPHQILDDLSQRGHKIEIWDSWTHLAGGVSAIEVIQSSNVLKAAADPRREGYAIAS